MESMQSVVDILGCSSSTARVLLTFFRWDTEALFGALAERGPEWVYTAANVTSRSKETPSVTGALAVDCSPVTPFAFTVLQCRAPANYKLSSALSGIRWVFEELRNVPDRCEPDDRAASVRSTSNSSHGPAGDDGEVECGTCFCNVPREEATAMECGHAFCDDCWRQHLTIQITDGNARRLPCMAVKCGVICNETEVSQTAMCQDPAECEASRQSLPPLLTLPLLSRATVSTFT
jgi:hypothetical protein